MAPYPSLSMVAPPMPSTCAMVRRTNNVGTTVVLKHCDMTTPVPLSELSFQWSHNDADIVPGGRFSINQHGWLTIWNVQDNDLGIYRVNISNAEGSAVHTVNLEMTHSKFVTVVTDYNYIICEMLLKDRMLCAYNYRDSIHNDHCHYCELRPSHAHHSMVD